MSPFDPCSPTRYRYHPYCRPSAIHLTFTLEAPLTDKLTIHKVFAMDPNPGLPSIRPLLHKPTTEMAKAYFEAISIDPACKPKPSGEAGRPSRNGYTLSKALDWPDDIYKEIQACYHR